MKSKPYSEAFLNSPKRATTELPARVFGRRAVAVLELRPAGEARPNGLPEEVVGDLLGHRLHVRLEAVEAQRAIKDDVERRRLLADREAVIANARARSHQLPEVDCRSVEHQRLANRLARHLPMFRRAEGLLQVPVRHHRHAPLHVPGAQP